MPGLWPKNLDGPRARIVAQSRESAVAARPGARPVCRSLSGSPAPPARAGGPRVAPGSVPRSGPGLYCPPGNIGLPPRPQVCGQRPASAPPLRVAPARTLEAGFLFPPPLRPGRRHPAQSRPSGPTWGVGPPPRKRTKPSGSAAFGRALFRVPPPPPGRASSSHRGLVVDRPGGHASRREGVCRVAAGKLRSGGGMLFSLRFAP